MTIHRTYGSLKLELQDQIFASFPVHPKSVLRVAFATLQHVVMAVKRRHFRRNADHNTAAIFSLTPP